MLDQLLHVILSKYLATYTLDLAREIARLRFLIDQKQLQHCSDLPPILFGISGFKRPV